MFSKKLKKLREEKGLTKKELAEKIGVSEVMITRLENSSSKPNEELIDKICKVLDCDSDYFSNKKKTNSEIVKEEKKEEKEEKEEKDYLEINERKTFKSISKVIYILAKISRILLYVAIPFILLGIIIIPSIISRIDVNENTITFKDFKGEIYSITGEDISLKGKYVIKYKDEVINDEINFDILKSISEFFRDNSKGKITFNIETILVISLVIIILTSFVLYYLEKLFKNIYNYDSPFKKENINYLYRIGKFMVITTVLSYVVSMFIEPITGMDMNSSFKSFTLIEILIIYSLVFIFKYGYRLEDKKNY